MTQPGNRRADVFEVDADREAYLRLRQNYARCHGLDVWAYCLMTNHVHLVVVPEREESLGQGLRDAHTHGGSEAFRSHLETVLRRTLRPQLRG